MRLLWAVSALGVLNVNNIRDLGSDQAAGKITLAVRMGERLARKYHVLLLLVGLGSVTLFGWAQLLSRDTLVATIGPFR